MNLEQAISACARARQPSACVAHFHRVGICELGLCGACLFDARESCIDCWIDGASHWIFRGKKTYEDVENTRSRCGRAGWRTPGDAGQRRDRRPARCVGAERPAAGTVAAGAGSQTELPPLSPAPGLSLAAGPSVCPLAARLLPAVGGSSNPALLLAALVPRWVALLMRLSPNLGIASQCQGFAP